MPDRPAGPICLSNVGKDWIDDGTTCRTRTSAPGPARANCDPLGGFHRDPFASVPQATAKLVYSKAKEAAWKRRFDEKLAGTGLLIVPSSDAYWQALIGTLTRSTSCDVTVDGLQFFVIRGGFEGFLAPRLQRADANRANWDDRDGTTDLNDVLVILNSTGGLLGAFQLAVPNYYPRTATMVADDWNGRAVFSYWNNTFSYYGLAVLDRGKLPDYDPKVKKYKYWIDIHHNAGTLGCIEIAQAASTKQGDFDSFVSRLGKSYGKPRDEQYSADKDNYQLLEPSPGHQASSFTVHMKSYLGRIWVLDIPDQ